MQSIKLIHGEFFRLRSQRILAYKEPVLMRFGCVKLQSLFLKIDKTELIA